MFVRVSEKLTVYSLFEGINLDVKGISSNIRAYFPFRRDEPVSDGASSSIHDFS